MRRIDTFDSWSTWTVLDEIATEIGLTDEILEATQAALLLSPGSIHMPQRDYAAKINLLARIRRDREGWARWCRLADGITLALLNKPPPPGV